MKRACFVLVLLAASTVALAISFRSPVGTSFKVWTGNTERIRLAARPVTLSNDVENVVCRFVVSRTNSFLGGTLNYSMVFKSEGGGLQTRSGVRAFSAAIFDGSETIVGMTGLSDMDVLTLTSGVLQSTGGSIRAVGDEKRTIEIICTPHSSFGVNGQMWMDIFLRSDAEVEIQIP